MATDVVIGRVTTDEGPALRVTYLENNGKHEVKYLDTPEGRTALRNWMSTLEDVESPVRDKFTQAVKTELRTEVDDFTGETARELTR